MRIRKRKVPLPLSLLSPIPITDAHLYSRSSVTQLVQPTQDQTTHTSNVTAGNNSQPSDHLTTFDLRRSIDDGNSSNDQHHDCLGLKGVESVPKSNDAGNKSITALGAAAGACCINAPLPLPHHQEKMGWCDEDKTMPLKKRRGSLDSTETTNVVDSISKSLENYVEKSGVDEEEIKDSCEINSNGENGKKGSKRGRTIMEGSRCSRVNGRGWRCCQPTLVGYSLCEHHLGKGRLRNMSGVRGRTSPMSKKAALGTSSETVGNSNEKMKKRAKIGVVKARSLSSLLGQTQTADTSSSNDSSGIAAALEYGKEIL